MENEIRELRGLLDSIIGETIDNKHSEELANKFFDQLNNEFKVPTVAYAIFLILVHTYEMIASQDEMGAVFFKKLMMDCVESLGDDE